MSNSRSKLTKDAISILQGAVKHLTDRLDRIEIASEELRERIEQTEKTRIVR